ncbi:polyprenyl synthetase family protein [Saccharothrix syringae]|uniref:Polyprenyl synthetase family protein n=1 Tax=Saccharothrix syringae TaxID=103733 RepID=A0A5Q0H7I6_SACSY|nr:polyprenyl synthetase family protein [Saccharothrix syringae]QFZ22208.1 polyprenyl synthetase family protein [Saccharothrix syringae]
MTVIEAVRTDLDGVRAGVDAVLDRFLEDKARAAPDPCLPPLVEVLREFLAGGKRLRPLFCHTGFLAAGGSPADPAPVLVGAALELFHSSALVHDDIMDRSALRRGRPTVHRLLAERFGDERLGVNTAILVGDLCFGWSGELLDELEVDPARMVAVRDLLHTMRIELIAGQYLDLARKVRGTADPVRAAWRVIRLKTARYTVELPLRIGAALAGADAALMRACGAYGRPVGEAYQLRDDLLGVFGDPRDTGKPALDDLREGKHTVLMALARQQATPEQREVITALLGAPDLDRGQAERLRAAVRATGAGERVERLIAVRVERALGVVRAGAFHPSAKPVLTELVAQATRRGR